MAIGAVIVAPDGTRHTLSRIVGKGGCSNTAETLALIGALEEAERLGARRVDVRCDCSVVIAHTVGPKRTQIPRLAAVYADARAAIDRFEHVAVSWVPRHRNTEADALARAALQSEPR